MGVSSREAALNMLLFFERQKGAVSPAFPKDKRDRAFAFELYSTTLKYKLILDKVIEIYSHRPLERLSLNLKNALRLGISQMLFLGTPVYAAINSTVECLKKPSEKNYCNGVLRNISRELGHIQMPDLDLDAGFYLSQRFSAPEFIIRIYLSKMGLSEAGKALYLANSRPVLTARVNRRKTDRESLMQKFVENGYEVSAGRFGESFYVQGGGDVKDMPGFETGLFSVQDEGAMAIGYILSPKPGDRVWDACAAPGGKATHMAEIMEGKGYILATDIEETRVNLTAKSLKRLGHKIVKVSALDAASHLEAGFFDSVLLDAPCTGLGILRKHPDLRWQKRPEDVFSLASIQKDLLKNMPKNIKPGGSFVYSTCTLTAEENEKNWAWFLENNEDMEPDFKKDPLPFGFKYSWDREMGFLYIWPDEKNDGFFVAKARKKGGG